MILYILNMLEHLRITLTLTPTLNLNLILTVTLNLTLRSYFIIHYNTNKVNQRTDPNFNLKKNGSIHNKQSIVTGMQGRGHLDRADMLGNEDLRTNVFRKT